VVRKWSYITLFNKKSRDSISLTSTTTHASTLLSRFKFKVFRKNTRFKKYNLGCTNFTRKKIILKKRRVGWKNYVILSSNWVKPLLKLKQIVNFTQSKLAFTNVVSYSHTKIFNKQSYQLSLVGSGTQPINYTTLNFRMIKFFTKTNHPVKNKKMFSNAQFNSVKNLEKLISLGFTFPSLIYDNNNYPTKRSVLHITLPGSVLNSCYNSTKTNLPLVLSILVSWRSIYTCITLLCIKTNKN
jgi:hypothetical protein